MNAAGSLGFAPDFRDFGNLGGLELGAFVTNPLSLRSRLPTKKPELIEYPGGFLLHTGLPNLGFNAAIKNFASRWDKSDLPIIVHLMADRPEETQHMVQTLEVQENVMAAELGFAPLLADDILLLTLAMCSGELPLIFSLPVEQILSLGPRLIREGAQVQLITGRLYGPSLFPRALETVYSATKLGLPIIGAGGVYSKENADAMLSVGALAVQLDAALWNPNFNFSA